MSVFLLSRKIGVAFATPLSLKSPTIWQGLSQILILRQYKLYKLLFAKYQSNNLHLVTVSCRITIYVLQPNN